MYCPYCQQDTAGNHAPFCPNWDYENSKQPYMCPVCRGNGIVSEGFYRQTSGMWASSGGMETCRSCNGTGIVWG